MTRFAKLILLATLLTGCAAQAEAPAQPDGPASEAAAPAEPAGPFSIILFIADGAGLNYWSVLRAATPGMALEAFPVIGLAGTRSANSRVTDSAAGATAYAAGVKTYNGAVGVGPDSTPVVTVLERAEDRGKATGLVATSTITHATPAAFAAHVIDRNMYDEIAMQLADADIEVLLGGGRTYFDPAQRPDGEDLIGRLRRRATVVDSAVALARLIAAEGTNGAGTGPAGLRIERLVGFTSAENPPPAYERLLPLADLTHTALGVLERDEDGFFLMVEGSQIDWRGHDNVPLRELIPELQDLERAIREALRFQERRPNTLIVVTADHETGGMAFHYDEMGVFRAHYTTESHTAGLVPLFAIGPGATALGGIRENDEIGRILMGLIEEDGPGTR